MFHIRATWRLCGGLAVVAILIASAVCSAQTSPIPTVTIPVIVTDQKGGPVSGLTEKNFSLEPAQTTDKIVAVKEVKTSNAALRRYPPSGLKATNIFKTEDQSPRRVFLLVVDEPNLEMRDMQRVALRKEAVSALVKALRAGEQGGLASYDGYSVTLVHDFASPPSLLFAAVHQLATDLPNADTFSPPQQGGANPQDLTAEVDRIKNFLQGPSSAPKSEIVGGVPVKFHPSDLGFGIQTLSVMKSLSQMLAGVPGSKALVWITSYSTLLLSDKTGTITEMIGPTCFDADKPTIRTLSLVGPNAQETSESLLAFRILAGSGVAVYPIRVGSYPSSFASGSVQGCKSFIPRPPGTEPATTLRSLPGSTERPSDAAFESNLGMLADFTGGRFDPHRTDISDAVLDTLHRMGEYYVLDVIPPDSRSPTLIRISANQEALEATSPRFIRIPTPTATVASGDSADLSLLPSCHLAQTGVSFVVGASAKTGNSNLEVVFPRLSLVAGSDNHMKLRILVSPQSPGITQTSKAQVIEGNVRPDQQEKPLRHTVSIELPPNISSVCVVARNELTGAIGSVVLPF